MVQAKDVYRTQPSRELVALYVERTNQYKRMSDADNDAACETIEHTLDAIFAVLFERNDSFMLNGRV